MDFKLVLNRSKFVTFLMLVVIKLIPYFWSHGKYSFHFMHLYFKIVPISCVVIVIFPIYCKKVIKRHRQHIILIFEHKDSNSLCTCEDIYV